MYLTGYLTRVRTTDFSVSLKENETALMILNAEIREIFEKTIVNWFQDHTKVMDREVLFSAIWSGNHTSATLKMNKLLRKTISYHDYNEDFYHTFLAGVFAGAGYAVESNREHGEGRSDVIVRDSENARVAIFEAKYAKSLEELEPSCQAALKQINDRMYSTDFEENFDLILCYDIAFHKKRCLIKIIQ